ncbi:hypothetical protein I3B42_11095 [Salmonella enterica]|nr:hypothetical protein [Salmonella enterica]
MTIFNGLLEAKKGALKKGAIPALAIAIEAPNKKVAENIIIGKLWEAYPDHGDSYFKPQIWEDSPGQQRSKVGEFDETFATEHSFDGEKWVENPGERGEMLPDAKPETASPRPLPAFNDLSAHDRWIYVLLFDENPLNNERLEHVVECSKRLENIEADSSSFDLLLKNTLHAAARISSTWDISIEKMASLKQAIFERFEAVHKPGTSEIQAFLHDQLGAEKVKRNYTQTHATLDREIACALVPVEPEDKISTSILRAADEIISQDREDFKRWSMALRTTEQILKYDRASIFGVIQCAPAKDTYHFPESLRRHIDNWLAENGRFEEGAATEKPKDNVQIVNHGGHFSVEGLMPESPLNQGAKSEVPAATDTKPQQEQVTDTQADQARETLNEMGYGVYATPEQTEGDTEQPEEKLSDKVQTLVQDAEALVERVHVEEHQHQNAIPVIDELQDIDNLALWNSVSTTDHRYTKPVSIGNYSFTSITAQYMFKLATRSFGPIGKGWGYEIVEDEMLSGKPMMEMVTENGKSSYRILRDADGSIIRELYHALRIEFWYRDSEGKHRFESWGHTPYLTAAKDGKITADGEVKKKSLTDAIKKALSMLGFCADVFMGQYDDPMYVNEIKTESTLSEAAAKTVDKTIQRQEFDSHFSRAADTLKKAASVNEIDKLSSKLLRELGSQQKEATSIGNTDFASYLGGRIRRLGEIVDARRKELTEQEQTA